MIKMRVSKDNEAMCTSCMASRQTSVEMLDIAIGKTIVSVCDLCNKELFTKVLTADCNVNAKIKTPRDMKVINKRLERRGGNVN